jgi:hypothetical protein
MQRKVIYGVIYIGIAIAFPALPLQGLKFIGGMLRGGIEGTASHGADMAKEQLSDWKHDLFQSLNPFE